MSKERKIPVHTYWEYVLPALAIASLLFSCAFISSKKFFWNDELYSYYFTSDPSFGGMLAAFHDKINNTPFLYFLLGWIWDKGFGSSELSLRLFSSLGMCTALIVTWITMRRHFRFWPTAVGVLGVFCTSDIIISQNAEARMYGLFLALCAVALLLYDQFYKNQKPSMKLLVLNGLVHVAIVHTHLFGGFYSGATLLAMLVSDWLLKIWRPRVYLSVILSWFSVLLYLPSFLIQADAGKPRTWLPEPVIQDLLDMFNFSAYPFIHQTLLIVLVIVSALLFCAKEIMAAPTHRGPKPTPGRRSKVPVIIFGLAYVILPLFIWIISVTVKPIFWDRYMIPSALGWVIMLTYFSSRLIYIPPFHKQIHPQAGRFRYLSASIFVVSALLLSSYLLTRPILVARAFQKQVQPGLDDSTGGYNDLPVVVQYSWTFLERIHYAPDPDKYYFILDWEAAVDEQSGLYSPQEYKHLTAIKRNYPQVFENNILPSEEFLERFDRFLVLDHPDYTKECPLNPKGLNTAREWGGVQCPQWVEMRLLNNAAYKVTLLNNDYWFSVLLVEKVEELVTPTKTVAVHRFLCHD